MNRTEGLLLAGILVLAGTQIATTAWIVSKLEDVENAVPYLPNYDGRLRDMSHQLDLIADSAESIDKRQAQQSADDLLRRPRD